MRRLLLVVAAMAGASAPLEAAAQPRPTPPRVVRPVEREAPQGDATLEQTSELRQHFGVDLVRRLLRGDPGERLRGIARAAALKSPEALAVLVREAEPNGRARIDAKTTLEVTRALAGFVEQPTARVALIALVSATAGASTARAAPVRGSFVTEEAAESGRLQLARQTAAIALAATGDPRAIEALITIARLGGVGQTAATAALAMFPPPNAGTITSVNVNTPAMLRLVAQLGDLRVLEVVRGLAKGGNDPLLRAAALVAMGELGDMRAVDAANAGLKEHDNRVKVAATEALVLLGASERFKAVEALIGEDATAAAGVKLAERAPSDGVVKALTARAAASGDPMLRAAAVAAIGRAPLPSAVKALVELLKDPWLQSDAANALGRSPAPGAMTALEAMAKNPATRRLGVRAYVVRTLTRGESSSELAETVAALAASRDGGDRAVGVGALVAMGKREPLVALGDADARVRRAAAVASLGRPPDPRLNAAMLSQLLTEKDAATRDVLAIGLIDGDPDGRVPTLILIDRAESSSADSALSALALARRGDDAQDAKVSSLLQSRDALVRAHAARGLGMSGTKDAAGRLAEAYAYEPEVAVRRAVVAALASRRGADADAPSRLQTLQLAARLDPDRVVRFTAARALAGLPASAATPARVEVLWLRLATADGRPPPPDMTAALVRADGLAVPIAFDDDGYALVPGVPAGDARLVLAPRLPAYEASKP